MALTLEEVRGLAALTRLALEEEEQTRLRDQLEAILEYVNRLAQVDTTGVPEVEDGREAFVGRKDELGAREESVRELILENFPDSVAGALKVPAVFEKPKG